MLKEKCNCSFMSDEVEDYHNYLVLRRGNAEFWPEDCFKMYDDSWCIAAGSSISGLVMHQFVRCWTQMFGNMKRCLDIGHIALCPVTALLLVSIFTLERLAISTLHPSLEMIMLILTFNYNTNLENASLKLLIWLSVSCGSSIVFFFCCQTPKQIWMDWGREIGL